MGSSQRLFFGGLLAFTSALAACGESNSPPPQTESNSAGITYSCGIAILGGGGTYAFTKTPSTQTVKAGAPFTWNVELDNNCTLPILNLGISDPVNEAIVDSVASSGSLACSNTDHSVSCAALTGLVASGSVNFTINASAPLTTGTIYNQASMSGLINAGGVLGVLSTVAVTEKVPVIVQASNADLSITKMGPAALTFNEQGDYTITITNEGTDTVYPGLALVTDTIDALYQGGANIIIQTTPSHFQCARNNRTVTCTNNEALPSGYSGTLVIRVRAGTTAGTASNTATVLPTADGLLDAVLANNTSATVMTTISSPVGTADFATPADLATPSVPDLSGLTPIDLSVIKVEATNNNGGVSCIKPLEAFGYVITVSNNSAITANGISISDSLPAGVVCADSDEDWDCPATMAGTVTCTKHDPLVAGGKSVLTINCSSPLRLLDGNIPANQVTVEAGPTNYNTSASATASSAAIVVSTTMCNSDRSSDLALEQTVSSCIAAGGPFTYTFTLTNNGPDAAGAARISMNLPIGVVCDEPSTVGGTGWSCEALKLSGPVNCTANSPIASGAARMMTLSCTAPNATIAISNPAVATNADFAMDPSNGNDTATTNSTIVTTCSPSDLNVNAHIESGGVTVTSVTTGSTFNYVITVVNPAGGNLTDVVVTDTLPTVGTVGTLPTGQGCTITAGVITCDLPSVGSAPVVITIPFTAPAAPAVITNTTNVSSTQSGDTNSANNTVVLVTNVVNPSTEPQADVSLIKDDSDDPVIALTPFTYDFTITNHGPNLAASLTLTDALPAGVVFDSSTTPNWNCVGVATIVCVYSGPALAPGATTLLHVTMTAVEPTASTAPAGCPSGTRARLDNSATVAVVGANDPVTSNNTDTETTCVVTSDHVNEAPINMYGGSTTFPATLAITENAPFTFTGTNAITVSDPDVVESPVEVTITVTNGTYTLSGTTGLTFTVGDGTADTTITFRGTLTDVNAALAGSFFTPNSDYTGPASISVTTNDLGKTGSGGPKSDTDVASGTVSVMAAADMTDVGDMIAAGDMTNVGGDMTDVGDMTGIAAADMTGIATADMSLPDDLRPADDLTSTADMTPATIADLAPAHDGASTDMSIAGSWQFQGGGFGHGCSMSNANTNTNDGTTAFLLVAIGLALIIARRRHA